MLAEVIINRSAKKLNRTFDYHVPKELEDLVMIGSKVLVPFGRGEKLEEAFIVSFKEKSEFEVKDIAKLEDNLSEEQIELARWMAKRYFCTVSDCIKLMLTPGTRNKKRENRIQDKLVNCIYLKKEKDEIDFDIETGKIKSDKHKQILKFVASNEGVTVTEIEMFTGGTRAIVNTLIKNEYLEVIEKKVERNPLALKQVKKSNPFKLTEEQEDAYLKVEQAINEEMYKKFLLFGVTGSRKNRNLFTINSKSIRQ